MDSRIFRGGKDKGCSYTSSMAANLQHKKKNLTRLYSKAAKKATTLSHKLQTMLGGKRSRKYRRNRRARRTCRK